MMKKLIFVVALTITLFPHFSTNVLAAPIDFDDLQKKLGKNFGSVGDILSAILPTIFTIAGFFLLYQLISGGFALMFSKGDQRAVEAVKAKITNAVIGFILLFVAYWLVQIIGQVLNINVFSKMFQ